MIILAVDDDEEDVEFFCDAIREIDHSIIVTSARNGTEALQHLEENILLPDFTFLDINMPLMDGRTFLHEIRKERRYKDIPVVMYSTSQNEREIKEYKKLGAKFLVKPGSFTKLVHSLSFILGYSNGTG